MKRTDALDILVVEDDPLMQEVYESCFADDGHRVTIAGGVDEALARVDSSPHDLAFVDLNLGEKSGLDLTPQLQERCPWIKVVLVTGHGTIPSAVEAMKRGASDYLTKPISPTQLRVIAERLASVLRMERRIEALEERVSKFAPDPYLESDNPAMRRALQQARKVAETDAIVLLTGESGTGKGLLAQAIHDWSRRSEEMFSAVSCPSLTPELLRSELFGHVKGAFTGAVAMHPGRIAVADGGTLFLDEIGDMAPSIQPQLLRFIQDREYERLGDTRTRTADVRILAATNRDLGEMVETGEFREDLWYRLRVVEIELPPLRKRREDIPALAETFLRFFATKHGRPIIGFSEGATQYLIENNWPGNARELRNAIERAVIFCTENELPADLLRDAVHERSGVGMLGAEDGLVSLEKMEARYITYVLDHTDSIEEAAEVLDVAPSTLWRRRRKYGI